MMEKNLYWDEKYPIREISRVLAKIDKPEEVEEFLSQLFTPSEKVDLGKRWALVHLLNDGMSQRRIAKELGISLCKITRGSKELKKEDSAFRRMLRL